MKFHQHCLGMGNLYVARINILTYLVGGLEHFFHILGRITPTDFHIFQRARSTTNQIY